MTYVTTYACSVGKIATKMSYVTTYVYCKMVFEGLIQLNCHLIQHVTLIYSLITCLSTKLLDHNFVFRHVVGLYISVTCWIRWQFNRITPQKIILWYTYVATYDIFVGIFPTKRAYVATYVTLRMT